MKKRNDTIVTKLEFGRIEENITRIPAWNFEESCFDIYIDTPIEEADDYLLNLVRTVPADRIHNYFIHWTEADGTKEVKSILAFFGEE